MDTQDTKGTMMERSRWFWLAVAVLACLLAGLAWWIYRPTYTALYRNASEVDQATILATLEQWRVPYRINAAEGVIEVPSEQLANARMRLVETGVPARQGIGFELFDQADYGMSEFSQKINYQRALEGELARTIMSIAEVQSARVHLTFRKASLYQKESEQPKASVVVRLRSGETLDAGRVRGIQQLIASAVEGMDQEHVVVLDENGHLLSLGDALMSVPEHLQAAARLEGALRDKALGLLAGTFGASSAKVSVRVQLNFDRVKSVKETPFQPAGKNTVQREKQNRTAESSSGESNSKREQSSKETDFALGLERAEVEHAAGRVERISVGVVLPEALAKDVITDLRQLLEAALGLDEARGDRIVITYLPGSAPDLSSSIVPESNSTPNVSSAASYAEETMRAKEASVLDQSTLLLIIGGSTGCVLFLWLLWRGTRRAPATQAARLSSIEREQLLQDVQRWLQEGSR